MKNIEQSNIKLLYRVYKAFKTDEVSDVAGVIDQTIILCHCEK